MREFFEADKGLIKVRVRLYGPASPRSSSFLFALDTGATTTVVGWDIATFLGYEPSAVSERAGVATGSDVIYCPRLKFDRIAALGMERRRFPVLCHTLPPGARLDGLLGLDFLRGTRLLIDFKRGVIDLGK